MRTSPSTPRLYLLGAFIAVALCAGTLSCGVIADPCDGSNCPGCCAPDGSCQPGTTDDACGVGGEACRTCTGGACVSGSCGGATADAGTDAGVCGEAGSETPSGRSDFAAAFDEAARTLYVYGGDPGIAQNCQSNPKFEGDLWAFDATCATWRKLDVPDAPSPRARHVGVFDPKRRRFVVFGGRYRAGTSGAYTTYADTFALSVGPAEAPEYAWAPLEPTGTPPPPLSSSAAVYDPAGDRMLVFGGNTSNNGATFTPVDRLWSLSFADNAWEELTPASGVRPAARLFHAIALDVKRNRLIVFAGGDANAFLGPFFDDTWSFDLGTRVWTQLASPERPMGRIRPALAYDAEHDFLLMFGGHDDGQLGERNDLWALDLAANEWLDLKNGDVFKTAGSGFCDFPSDFTTPDLASPERREGHAFGFIPGAGHLMFGGRTDCGVVNDVWSLTPVPGTWTQLRPTFVGLSCQRSGKEGCTKLCF